MHEKLVIFKIVIGKIKNFFFTFFYFKIFLLSFYFIGGYQSFSDNSIELILRLIVINDVFLLFFSMIVIISSLLNYRMLLKKIILVSSAIFNILFSILTISLSLFVIVLTAN